MSEQTLTVQRRRVQTDRRVAGALRRAVHWRAQAERLDRAAVTLGADA